jgi:beta-N-acetylhexosaminidase
VHRATPTPTPTSCTNSGVVAGWSLTRRAAALVVVPSLDFDVAGVGAELRAGAGGVLFLGRTNAPSDLAARLKPYAGASPLVMADEEGGDIQRLAGVVADFPYPQQQARTMSVSAVQALGARVGRQMRTAGVNVDLAPVLDVDDRPGPSSSNPDGQRSFSGDADTAASYGVAFMRGLESGGVLPVVKHFPGLGGSTGNTDVRSATTPPLSALQQVGLVPFRAAIRAGAPAVMVSNASVPGLTPLPSTLSHAVMTDLLRGQLGFRGLIVTDSLSAGAVQHVAALPEAVVRSLIAGADMVLFGSTLTPAATANLRPAATLQTFNAIVGAVVQAVQNGRLSTQRLNSAVASVLTGRHIDLCR